MVETIAEIGKNFVTTKEEQPEAELLDEAKKLVQSAKASGADTAKFQVHNVSDEIRHDAQIISPHFSEDRYEWVRRNTYSADFWFDIKEFCKQLNINFLATPMSRGAAIVLNEDVGIDRWKIGSGDITDYVLLDYVRDSGKPVILSSGMSSEKELRAAYEYVKEKVRDITILHCVSIYPCPTEKLNLNTIPYLKKLFPEAKIGFSDHSTGIEEALMAVKMGAEVVEKHFTFDRDSFGPDHKVSILPREMLKLTTRIKEKNLVEPRGEALGVETKYLQKEEQGFRPVFHKGLYAARPIEKGKLVHSDMICAMRPRQEVGLHAWAYPEIVDKPAERSYEKHQAL